MTTKTKRRATLRRKIDRLFKMLTREPDPMPPTTDEIATLQQYSILTSEISY